MIKIEERSNQMIDQIKTLIHKSFPPVLGYKVEYFLGEDSLTERNHLVFKISSKEIGDVYQKSLRLKTSKFVEDAESDFIGMILSDFMLLGTTFLTNTIMAKKASQKESANNIISHPFSKGRLNSINLN